MRLASAGLAPLRSASTTIGTVLSVYILAVSGTGLTAAAHTLFSNMETPVTSQLTFLPMPPTLSNIFFGQRRGMIMMLLANGLTSDSGILAGKCTSESSCCVKLGEIRYPVKKTVCLICMCPH